jgi:hypothetical protein
VTAKRELRAHRAAHGLCVNCGECRPRPGSTWCLLCARLRRARQARLFRKRSGLGLCRVCGRAEPCPGRAACAACGHKHRASNRKWKRGAPAEGGTS